MQSDVTLILRTENDIFLRRSLAHNYKFHVVLFSLLVHLGGSQQESSQLWGIGG